MKFFSEAKLLILLKMKLCWLMKKWRKFSSQNPQNEKNTNKEQNVEIDILRESSADNYWLDR